MDWNFMDWNFMDWNFIDWNSMDWNSSAFWGIIGLIGGFIVSFIFYKLSNKNKKILYTKNSQILVTNTLSEINGLNITYENYPIKDLTSTTITIKSVGKDIINMEDFGKATPFCIKTTEKFFLQSNINSIINKNSNPNNLIHPVVKDEATILLNFDYLSKEDEIVFVLLHTGTIDVDGKLKSGILLNKNSSKKFDIFLPSDLYWALIYISIIGQIALYDLEVTLANILENVLNFIFYLGLGLLLIYRLKDILSHIIINIKNNPDE